MIITKWQHIRDAFVRSLKKSSGQWFVEKYIYSENLKFILKVIQKDDTETSINETELSTDKDLNSLLEDDLPKVISQRSKKAKKE